MKKILLLILFFPIISFSQNTFMPEKFEDDYFPYFREGSYQYLIADKVNIRKGPSTNTSVVANLPIGSRLKIIKELPYRFTYNNINLPWYKVSFNLDGIETIGYVVGIFIAEAFYISDQNKNLIFLSGMSKYISNDKGLYYQVRVAYKNREIDRIEFLPSDYGDLNLNVSLNKEINNGIYIIQTRFVVGACYTQNNSTTLFFDKNSLYHIKTFSNEDNKYLGFKNGKIQLLEGYWFDNPKLPPSEMGDGNSYKEIILEEYFWNGRLIRSN